MTLDLLEARALGGRVEGRQVLAPGPGHSRKDSSLSVKLSHQSALGFIVHSHSGDDFKVSRDYVAERLGFGKNAWRRATNRTVDHIHGSASARAAADIVDNISEVAPDHAAREVKHDNIMIDHAVRVARARAIWDQAGEIRGSIAEAYLRGRGLNLDLVYDVNEVLRFHPGCPWRDEVENRTIYVPAMLAALRAIDDDGVTGIHRTRLTSDGVKVDRRMLGLASGSAIKLDADEAVSMGLAIGEGIETVMAARQLGFRPAWALGSAGAIAAFPVLPGVEALTLLAENDETNRRAVIACAERWHAAGCEVAIISPKVGSDLNDALNHNREVA